MKILVTGGAGYIGSVLTRLLLARGNEVRVLDSLVYGGHALLGLFPEDHFTFIKGDIRDATVLRKVLSDTNAVVHLAAIVGDPACARRQTLAREVNLEASLQLLRLSQELGIQRFIFASTCSNYGRTADPSVYLTEDSDLRPVSLYAETKVAVERILLNEQPANGLAACVLRFATVFGLSPRMRFDLTVNQFTMELLTHGKLMVFGEQFWRPYIHVRDVAEAICLALNAPVEKTRKRVYNVGDSSQNYQKGKLAELIRAQTSEQAVIEYVHKDEDPRDYRVSFERISRQLEFRITRTVEDGIREVAQVVREGIITDFNNPAFMN